MVSLRWYVGMSMCTKVSDVFIWMRYGNVIEFSRTRKGWKWVKVIEKNIVPYDPTENIFLHFLRSHTMHISFLCLNILVNCNMNYFFLLYSTVSHHFNYVLYRYQKKAAKLTQDFTASANEVKQDTWSINFCKRFCFSNACCN